MSRRYPKRPVVGVGGIVFSEAGVLLIKRGSEPGRGLWSIPGGAVELGETLHVACAREVLEETGLKVEVGPLVEVFERRMFDDAGAVEYHYVLLDYLCRCQADQPRNGDDAADAKWVSLAELEGVGLTPDTLRVIRKAIDMASCC